MVDMLKLPGVLFNSSTVIPILDATCSSVYAAMPQFIFQFGIDFFKIFALFPQ